MKKRSRSGPLPSDTCARWSRSRWCNARSVVGIHVAIDSCDLKQQPDHDVKVTTLMARDVKNGCCLYTAPYEFRMQSIERV